MFKKTESDKMLEQEKAKIKIVKKIKYILKQMPEFKVEESDSYQRLLLDPELLNYVFWNIYGEPNFSNKEMRKLDLSALNLTNEYVAGINFSYTNIEIDPQRVQEFSIQRTNLEGVDLSDKSLDGVDLTGANLRNTNAFIDFCAIRSYSKKTNFEGCYVDFGSAIQESIPFEKLSGCVLLDGINTKKVKQKILKRK